MFVWAHFAYFPAYSGCLDTNKGLTLLLYPHNPLLFIQMGIKPPIPTAGRWISHVSHTSAKSTAPSSSADMWLHAGESFFLSILSADSYIQSGLFTGCLLPWCLYLLGWSFTEGSLEISWWRDRNL